MNHHPSINQIDSNFLPVLPDHLHDVEFLLSALNIQLLESFSVDVHAFDFCLNFEEELAEETSDLTQHAVRLFFDLDKDIAAMAVSVDEVVLHQHLEKCC